MSVALLSSQNHIEVPFIIVKIGNYTFGHCEKIYRNRLQTDFNITFPNYMENINIVKVNGAVNTYNLTMIYGITPQDDPNRLEKVFSSISNSRTMKISYGDWNTPGFIYKDEEVLINKLTTNVSLKDSCIRYTINCTSSTALLTAGSFSFPARKAKPSDVLFELLANKRYGLTNIFTGMSNLTTVANESFIARDDKAVQLEAKSSINVFDYISYLVSCMVYLGDNSTDIKTCCYFWSSYDDISNKYGGSYFKVVRVAANTPSLLSYNTYEVDVGYPTSACVMDFSLNNDDSWSLLYNYTNQIDLPQNSYHINDEGELVQDNSSFLTASKLTYTTTEATRNWWSLVTQFPVTAKLTLKGLLRPAMLMSYVKVNTYFYGHKHISSGLYMITKQEDSISSTGYRTTLTLLRVGGDEHYS